MRHRATLPIGYNSAFLRSKNSERSWKRNVSTRSKAPCSTCAIARASSGGIFDYDAKAARLTEVNKELEDPNVWNDSKNAQALGREKKLLEGVVTTLTALDGDLRDALDLFELAREEGDEDTLIASEEDAAKLEARVGDIEFRRMFSNPADPNNCFIDIQAGAGGTEACDWASMLLRQYLRYCERKGFKAEVLEESDGDVAGIKNATVKVSGEYAYGFLRTETGIHRLVRKSPFDSSGGRHTSFSSVFVYPTTRSRSRSTRPTCASTRTAHRARAASTSTRPTPRCGSRTCRPVSSCSARTTARSTATAPKRWQC